MLREVLKLKGLNLDEVATFGDGLNDVCMLKGFPYSFTPANGCKEAKEAATYTLTKTGGNGAIQEGLHILKRFRFDLNFQSKSFESFSFLKKNVKNCLYNNRRDKLNGPSTRNYIK